ncbi:MAG TPA: hypothetical protein DEQ17_04495 [Prevotella sp.]|nr:hypothetical protein [Prevotella sp.]
MFVHVNFINNLNFALLLHNNAKLLIFFLNEQKNVLVLIWKTTTETMRDNFKGISSPCEYRVEMKFMVFHCLYCR